MRSQRRSSARGRGFRGHGMPCPVPGDRRCLAAVVGLAGGRQGGQGGCEEPGVEEVVELLAADLFGEGDEVLGGRVAVVEASGPGAQDGEERLVADGQAQRVQRQRAALVDDGVGEELRSRRGRRCARAGRGNSPP